MNVEVVTAAVRSSMTVRLFRRNIEEWFGWLVEARSWQLWPCVRDLASLHRGLATGNRRAYRLFEAPRNHLCIGIVRRQVEIRRAFGATMAPVSVLGQAFETGQHIDPAHHSYEVIAIHHREPPDFVLEKIVSDRIDVRG